LRSTNKRFHNFVAAAEAMAMKEGLLLTTSTGCNAIIAESDSSETIDACTGGYNLVE
jgi:hypothetical protein